MTRAVQAYVNKKPIITGVLTVFITMVIGMFVAVAFGL
ncbi:MAG: hypothetical protein G01um101491_201, partial [Parcubacteria group bacterium Gr01-1014_91]